MNHERLTLDKLAIGVGFVAEIHEQRILDLVENRRLRIRLAYSLIGIFSTFNVAVMVLCFLSMPLSDVILGSLIAATAVETATMTFVVVKYLFPIVETVQLRHRRLWNDTSSSKDTVDPIK